jgi:Rne/Rng family ribonuclease
MSKEMVISANPHETRVAILEEGQLCEFYVEREKEFALVGSIYKGRVTRVLPGMQSAFVDIGLDSDAFLYVSDFLEDIEEFDHIVTTVEDKVQKMEDQGGQVFSAAGTAAPAMEPADVVSLPVAGAEPPASSEFAPPPAISPAPAPIAAPPARPPVHDRGRFDRPRPEGRPGGRFGGRGGRRGGRPGRGGGGGRGGDRRYGRDLPQSKYASPGSYDDRTGAATPGEGHLSVILPGESLAKYRDKPPAPPESAHPVEEAQATPVFNATPVATPHVSAPAPTEFRASSASGLEPLPGESLSKWKTHAPPAEEHVPTAFPAPEPREESPEHREDRESFEAHERHSAEAAEGEHADHPATELSEDEATSLAEHVAEAQNEEAARAAQDRAFASSEETHEHGLSEAEDSAIEAAEEDELSRAEAESESEAESEAEAEEEAGSGPEEFLGASGEGERAEASSAEAAAPAENGAPPSPEISQPQDQQPWNARVRGDFRARMQHPARRDRGRDRGRRDDRGRRPQHGHVAQGHHRPQPRRTQLIADMLKQGQEIIVQIAKEPLGKKGARITSHVALPGRFLVYMPTLDHTGVSRKIASAEDRARLRHLVSEAKGAGGGGFIVRTAAASATPEEVRADVEFLMRTWADIKSRAEQRKAPSLLHRDLNLVERILRDYITSEYGAIWVDSEEEFAKVVEFMSRFQPDLVNRVKLYTKETPVFEEFGIQQEIDKGLRPKVWLKSGGYIVINHTEALVAIDVNTGKFVGKGSTRLEDTIVRTNLEAVKEIVRQMRLRDLGGIIIIDFIDMEERRNREKVMAALDDALRADRAPSKVLRFNEFGLVAITRKRTKQALERTLCQPCPYCTGSGMVKSIPTLCYEIQTEARKMAPEVDSASLTLRVHPEIAKSLKTRESSLVEELERWTKKSVIIQADPTLHWEQYDIY